MIQTEVTQFLDGKKIPYTVQPLKNKVVTCEEAAKECGMRLSQIVKCIIGEDKNDALHVILIPGDKKLKPALLKQTCGGKINFVSRETLETKFNLIVGAISPAHFIGKAKFYIDNSLFREKTVSMGSGKPDAGIELSTEDFCSILNAAHCNVIAPDEP